jgi:hypothetical protein
LRFLESFAVLSMYQVRLAIIFKIALPSASPDILFRDASLTVALENRLLKWRSIGH